MLTLKEFRKIFFIILGATLFSYSIESFLVPNQIIDGGIVGISIIFSYLFDIRLGLLLFILNIPFIIFGYKTIGKRFALYTMVGISLGSTLTYVFHQVSPFTDEPLLASIFGGIVLGVGVGLVIRNGGSLDGTEITAILLNKKLPFSVGEIVMFFNIFILGSAGFVFGWDRAMYSFIAYFLAYKTIDVVIEGFEETRAVWIISDYSDAIGASLLKNLGRGATFLAGEGGYTGEDKKIVFTVITRLEEPTLRSIVEEIDKKAFIAIGHIHEVRGGNFKNKH